MQGFEVPTAEEYIINLNKCVDKFIQKICNQYECASYMKRNGVMDIIIPRPTMVYNINDRNIISHIYTDDTHNDIIRNVHIIIDYNNDFRILTEFYDYMINHIKVTHYIRKYINHENDTNGLMRITFEYDLDEVGQLSIENVIREREIKEHRMKAKIIATLRTDLLQQIILNMLYPEIEKFTTLSNNCRISFVDLVKSYYLHNCSCIDFSEYLH